MKKKLLAGLAIGVMVISLLDGKAFATIISPKGGYDSVGILTDLGSFSAGNYIITGSGVVDLVRDGSFLMQPDGMPASPLGVTTPGYEYFNPNGSFTADEGTYGAAGANAKIGALIGTLSANPVNQDDWFLIGYSTQVTLTTTSHIYASVNDTSHNNNNVFFEATVTAAPVPEPATMLLMGTGLVGMIGSRFRRKKA